jgi:hypothetical protein
MATTTTFDLPFGYEGEDGTTHKTVVMRRVSNRDLKEVADNGRIKALAKEGHKIDFSNIKSAKVTTDNPEGVTIDGEMDPITTERAQAAVGEMHCLLLGRVVLKIGTIPNPGNEIMLDLTPTDTQFMQKRYSEFNQPPVDKKPEEKKAPFAPSAS